MAEKSLCVIEDCGKSAWARGWCGAHLYRWRKYGDPLAGSTSWGEPEKYLQEVVLPYRGDDCLPWPYSKAGGGYGQIYRKSDRKLIRVNRIVCEEFRGPPPSSDCDAAHSCGKGHEGCCAPRHLEWKTHADNVADAKHLHGTWNRGENVPQSKLTAGDVRAIRKLKGKHLQREIAEQFGVARSLVSRIHSGHLWASVQD